MGIVYTRKANDIQGQLKDSWRFSSVPGEREGRGRKSWKDRALPVRQAGALEH